jgi:hypothetical protein
MVAATDFPAPCPALMSIPRVGLVPVCFSCNSAANLKLCRHYSIIVIAVVTIVAGY